ncbi:hypothetical protein BV898_06583 [Hypsibius exemplaris]|uniref:SP-RING-type domain-containing protein n=1 Tax=Hypsibius exemplaris TaxID=2072580 RepID=A0A1W0WVW1_HYPEX|nr:hypothetical protein BV898_06583 [Hypsibius exemplaris]
MRTVKLEQGKLSSSLGFILRLFLLQAVASFLWIQGKGFLSKDIDGFDVSLLGKPSSSSSSSGESSAADMNKTIVQPSSSSSMDGEDGTADCVARRTRSRASKATTSSAPTLQRSTSHPQSHARHSVAVRTIPIPPEMPAQPARAFPAHLTGLSSVIARTSARESQAIINHINRTQQNKRSLPVVEEEVRSLPAPTSGSAAPTSAVPVATGAAASPPAADVLKKPPALVPLVPLVSSNSFPVHAFANTNFNLPADCRATLRPHTQPHVVIEEKPKKATVPGKSKTYQVVGVGAGGAVRAGGAGGAVGAVGFAPRAYYGIGTGTIVDPPLHRVTSRLLGPQILSTVPTLEKRGCNRELYVYFHCNIPCLTGDEVLLIRFVKAGHVPAEQEIHPRNLQIFVNGFDVTQLEIVDHKAPTGGPRLFSPVVCHRDKLTLYNKLQVTWTVENTAAPPEDFTIFVELAAPRSMPVVLADIATRRLTLDQGVARAFGLCATADTDGISMNSSTISLLCTLLRKRAQLPVRGRNCKHLECYDASSYCQLNSGPKAKWCCPLCSLPTAVSDLVVDDFVVDLMRFTDQMSLNISAEGTTLVVSEMMKTKKTDVVLVADISLGDQSIIYID